MCCTITVITFLWAAPVAAPPRALSPDNTFPLWENSWEKHTLKNNHCKDLGLEETLFASSHAHLWARCISYLVYIGLGDYKKDCQFTSPPVNQMYVIYMTLYSSSARDWEYESLQWQTVLLAMNVFLKWHLTHREANKVKCFCQQSYLILLCLLLCHVTFVHVLHDYEVCTSLWSRPPCLVSSPMWLCRVCFSITSLIYMFYMPCQLHVHFSHVTHKSNTISLVQMMHTQEHFSLFQSYT